MQRSIERIVGTASAREERSRLVFREINDWRSTMKGMMWAIGVVLMAAPLVAQMTKVDFEKDQIGKPPAGWTATQTGSGRASWSVEKDDTAPSKSNVLKQSGVATYPVCLKDDTVLTDGVVDVK